MTGYTWNSLYGTCEKQCGPEYKYVCGYNLVEHTVGGMGVACDGKYTSCQCMTDYTWNAVSGTCEKDEPECDSSYKYTCTYSSVTHISGGSGTSCDGKYTACRCMSGYTWNSYNGTCEKDEPQCDSSYKYLCNIGNQNGGKGQTCGGLYKECNCAPGSSWDGSDCVMNSSSGGGSSSSGGGSSGNGSGEDSSSNNCAVGWLYYSDNKCYKNPVTGKTLLGIVVYLNGQHGQVMSINQVNSSVQWSSDGSDYDVPGCAGAVEYYDAQKDFGSCSNTNAIKADGNNSKYPAAYAAAGYSMSGKKWCLPAAGVLHSVYNNLDIINSSLQKVGGTLINSGGGDEHIWSSTEYTSRADGSGTDEVWYFCAFDGAKWGGVYRGLKTGHNGIYGSVRPVFEF